MTPQDPRFSEDDISSEPLAPEDVQLEIASMLRHAARTNDGPDARMPTHVETDLLAAFDAAGLRTPTRAGGEGPSQEASSDSAAPATMIPLPRITRAASTRETGAYSFDAAVDSTSHPASITTESSSTPDNRNTSVTDLSEHRRSKRRIPRAALSVGAAAAVALGALGIWHGTTGDSASHSGPAGMTQAAGAPQVRVTNSETAYTSRSLTTQAAELSAEKRPAITSPAEAQQAGLGELATKQGLETCVTAIDSVMAGRPDKIYADFGTYNGQPSVIVVVIKDGKKTAWAVNRTCTKESDARTGAHQLTT